MAIASSSLNLTGLSISSNVFVILIPYPACSLSTLDESGLDESGLATIINIIISFSFTYPYVIYVVSSQEDLSSMSFISVEAKAGSKLA